MIGNAAQTGRRTLALFSALTLGAWPVAALVPLAVGYAVFYLTYLTLSGRNHA